MSTAARALRQPVQSTEPTAVLPLLDAQTCIVECIESLVKVRPVEYDEVDARLGDAMRRLAEARSVIRDMKRAKFGQPTIAGMR